VFLYGYNFGIACFARAASALWFLGYPDQALERIRAALTLAQQQSHPFSLAYALCFAAECHRLRREERITQEWADAAIQLSTEQGFPFWMAGAMIFKGWALAEQGIHDEGIGQILKGLDAWRATGAEVGHSSWLAQLAEVYGRVGRIKEGLAILTEALTITNKNEERWWEAELYRLKGALLLQSKVQDSKSRAQGQKSHLRKLRLETKNPQAVICDLEVEAETAFRTALSIARRQQAKSLELRAAMSLARLWQRQRKYAEARQVLSEVYSWFTEGFDTADLQEARALLDELCVEVIPGDLPVQTIH
jgi:predicted ATPase